MARSRDPRGVPVDPDGLASQSPSELAGEVSVARPEVDDSARIGEALCRDLAQGLKLSALSFSHVPLVRCPPRWALIFVAPSQRANGAGEFSQARRSILAILQPTRWLPFGGEEVLVPEPAEEAIPTPFRRPRGDLRGGGTLDDNISRGAQDGERQVQVVFHGAHVEVRWGTRRTKRIMTSAPANTSSALSEP